MVSSPFEVSEDASPSVEASSSSSLTFSHPMTLGSRFSRGLETSLDSTRGMTAPRTKDESIVVDRMILALMEKRMVTVIVDSGVSGSVVVSCREDRVAGRELLCCRGERSVLYR